MTQQQIELIERLYVHDPGAAVSACHRIGKRL